MLRIALVVRSDVTIGGGRSYEQLLVSELLASLGTYFDFTIFSPKGYGQKVSLVDGAPPRHIRYASKSLSQVLESVRSSPMQFRLLERFGLERGSLEKSMARENIDLAYFLSPNPFAAGISSLPIVTTIWDSAHRVNPEFPEVSSRRRHEYRDQTIGQSARKSVAVIVESQRGREEVIQAHGVMPDRVLVLSFWALVRPWGEPQPVSVPTVVYPAQFWPHKNHLALIRALRLLKDAKRPTPKLQFIGGDRGNRGYIERYARNLGLDDLVQFPGFLPDEKLRDSVLRSSGLAMPSFFGPSNLPPIEALRSGIPVAVSTADELAQWADGSSIQAVNPMDFEGWALALERFATNSVSRPAKVPAELESCVGVDQVLGEVFTSFDRLRQTWSSSIRAW